MFLFRLPFRASSHCADVHCHSFQPIAALATHSVFGRPVCEHVCVGFDIRCFTLHIYTKNLKQEHYARDQFLQIPRKRTRSA